MRTRNLIEILLEERPNPITRADIAKRMNLSVSSIRSIIKETEEVGLNNGFCIELQKGKGYILNITNDNYFKVFIDEKQDYDYDVYDVEKRLEMLMFYILQAHGYITVSQLEEKMLLSRSTIVKELKHVDQELSKFNLKLERKAHYGVIVSGSEQDLRKAFSKYVLGSIYYLEPAKEYKFFIENLEVKELRNVLGDGLAQNSFRITDIAFNNIVSHLKTLIFRVSQENFISNESFLTLEIDEVYLKVAIYVTSWIEERYQISLPESEIYYLAAHISAKSITSIIDTVEKNTIYSDIRNILVQLDQEFLTNFQDDLELQDALLFHMFPLLKRLYYNLQLENPLIEEIYTKYANIFVVSYRFGELIEAKYGFTLSRDEIGYLALHFATYFERLKNQSLNKIKRIVIICTTGGGSAHLLRLKIESVFSNAIVVTTSAQDISDFETDLPDLFLSTIPIGDRYQGVPIIHIKQFLDEIEIRHIRENVYMQFFEQNPDCQTLKISQLFSDKLFQRNPIGNYLEIIKNQSDKMILDGFATKDFTALVLEREQKFSTIYQNGIAGPHSMKLNAKIDSVGITILEEPIEWSGKIVQLIFLINLKQGHLFLHKEISRLLLYLIENKTIRKKLIKSLSFEQFIAEIEKLD